MNIIDWSDKKMLLARNVFTHHILGWVCEVRGILVKGIVPVSKIGDVCIIKAHSDILTEVVGFDGEYALLACLDNLDGVEKGNEIHLLNIPHRIKTDSSLIGGLFDGYGRALHKGQQPALVTRSQEQHCIDVLSAGYNLTDKIKITEPLYPGIKVIDGLLTLAQGQRIGIFAGPGCGKTTLLLEIIKSTPCDVIVVGLIGERGRELNEFLEATAALSDRKIVIVCATSDKSSMERSRAAFTATALAESFCQNGSSVLLLIDSLTRFVRAQREIGIATGEPSGKTGLPSSVYTYLPRLVERAGNFANGSITAIYTVLFEEEGVSDPVAEEIKSLLDGHIVLSRKIAERGHFPAVDVLSSLSRLMSQIVDKEHAADAKKIKALLSSYKESEFLLRIGEYKENNDLLLDEAVAKIDDINTFTQQETSESYSFDLVRAQMSHICRNTSDYGG